MKKNVSATRLVPLALSLTLSMRAAAAIDIKKDVWFLADFDTPMRLNGAAFLQEQNAAGFVPGKFGKGYYFFRSGKDKAAPKTQGTVLRVTDPRQLATFPFRAGTSAFWVKNAPGVPEGHGVDMWGFNLPGASPWGMNAGRFSGGAGGVRLPYTRIPRRNEWTHVACSWREGRVAYFINGKRVNEIKDDGKTTVKTTPQKDPRATFRVGNFADGWGPNDAQVDEFVIFNRALDDDEISALARATKSLTDGAQEILAENVFFTTFFRDQKDAKMRCRVISPKTANYMLTVRVGDVERYSKKVSIKKGTSTFEFPLRPALYAAGKYDFAWSLTSSRGERVLVQKGELTIKGRLGQDPFIFNSWGGWKVIHDPVLKTLGINSYNLYWHEKEKIRAALDAGFFTKLRYENGNEWQKQDFDWAGIRAKTIADLSPLASLPIWRMALLNSEIYGVNIAKKAKDNPKYLKMAEAAIGGKPDFTYGDAPANISYKKLGIKPLRGEIDRLECPTLETLFYVTSTGLPSIVANYETAKAIKSVKPVTVWSEPAWGGLADSVDLLASWEYEYSIYTTLWQLRVHSATARAYGKPYMPTLAAGYWPEVKGDHPTRRDKNGKPEKVTLTQGSDEVAIKTWLSLGAIPIQSLGWFSIDSWEYGVSNTLRYAASPTNAIRSVAEVDCIERYGRRWHKDLAPAADLLRDMPNVPARVAYLDLPEIGFAGGFWWGHYHYKSALCGAMARGAANYDYVGRNDLLAGRLSDYEYIVYPMSRVVYKEHADILRALARRGVKIVLDSYASVRYEKSIVLDKVSYKANRFEEMRADFGSWYYPVSADVATRQGASSPATDGKSSFTFEKEYKGVRYVMVVNDLRDQKPSFLNTFKTNAWFRVVGAPQRIETEIRKVARGSKIYHFNGQGRPRRLSRKGTTVKVGGMYDAAEGAVYCVYPKALKAPSLSLAGTARPGTTVKLLVRIDDADGKPAPGRQVVELTLADGQGVPRDESGRYVVEEGCVEIPLRIAKSEKATGFSGKWRAKVVDFTTGKSETLEIAIK